MSRSHSTSDRLPLAPGTRYSWRLVIDGAAQDDWVLPFTTRRPARLPEA